MALGTHNVPGFSELLSATIQRIEGELVDQVLSAHPTLDVLRGKIAAGDGPNMTVPVRGALVNRTAVSDDLGTFNTGQDGDIVSVAKYEYSAPIVTPTSVAYMALALNAGSNQVIDLVKAHLAAATDDHSLAIAQALHAAGGIAGTFNSLEDLVDDTSVVGGIDPATSAWWKASVVTGAYATDDVRLKLREVMNSVFDASMKRPDVIIAGSNIYEAYESVLEPAIRYSAGGAAESRFETLKFNGIEIRRDGSDCPADRAYFLNTGSLIARNLRGTFMAPQAEQVIPGTLTTVLPLASVLLTGVNERRANGRLDMS